jgi:hypothetical protein
MVLEAARDGTLATLSARLAPVARLWGLERADEAAATLRCRSAATKGAAARAARNILEMRPDDEAHRAVEDASPWPLELDAWVQRYVPMRAGAIRMDPKVTWAKISPRATGSEVGNLMAAIEHALPEARFSLTNDQRDSCGCMARKEKTDKVAIPPATTHAYIVDHKAESEASPQQAALHAALALGAACGWPVNMIRNLKVDEVDVVFDHAAKRHAVVLRFDEREEGGVKVRRHFATKGAHDAKWSAVSTPAVALALVPWWRTARDAGWTYLFPRPIPRPGNAKKGRERVDGDQPVGARCLEDACKRLRPGATWHGHRVGVARAMAYVHTITPRLGEGPAVSEKVEQSVINSLMMRSNAKLVGSHNVYSADAVEHLMSATRLLHRVDFLQMGKMMAKVGGEVRVSTDDNDFATTCRRCEADIGKGVPGHMCDEPGCEWTLCIVCHTNGTEQLWCPEHDESSSSSDTSSDGTDTE